MSRFSKKTRTVRPYDAQEDAQEFRKVEMNKDGPGRLEQAGWSHSAQERDERLFSSTSWDAAHVVDNRRFTVANHLIKLLTKARFPSSSNN